MSDCHNFTDCQSLAQSNTMLFPLTIMVLEKSNIIRPYPFCTDFGPSTYLKVREGPISNEVNSNLEELSEATSVLDPTLRMLIGQHLINSQSYYS